MLDIHSVNQFSRRVGPIVTGRKCCLLSLSLILLANVFISARANKYSPRDIVIGTFELDGPLEVAQAIQDRNNSVSLVAGKSTLVRAYLIYHPAADNSAVTVTGSLNIQSAGGAMITLKADDSLTIDPTVSISPEQRRESLRLTLNFTLPKEATVAGMAIFSLPSVNAFNVADPQNSINMPLACSTCTTAVNFRKVPPLRVKIIGFRYSLYNPSIGVAEIIAPDEQDFAYIASWLRRAYPVPEVKLINPVVVPLPDYLQGLQVTCNRLNPIVSATRSAEVSGNTAGALTHYHGLLEDGNGTKFMRGCTSVPEDFPDPSYTGSGPTGKPSAVTRTEWVTENIYGGFYTGHELGHGLGRQHPGKCPERGEDRVDESPQAPDHIGDPGNTIVGYDLGDRELGIKPTILPGNNWTDIMTYCANEWMSKYTYEHILNRIIEEKEIYGPTVDDNSSDIIAGVTTSNPSSLSAALSSNVTLTMGLNMAHPSFDLQRTQIYEDGDFLGVTGTVNLTKRTGSLLPSIRVKKIEGRHKGMASRIDKYPQVKIRLRNNAGEVIADFYFPLRYDSDTETDQDITALIHGFVPIQPDIASMELFLVGNRDGDRTTEVKLDEVNFDKSKPKITKMSAKAQASGVGDGAAPPIDIRWQGTDQDSSKIYYFVEMSKDGGKSWITIAPYTTANSIQLDPKLGPGDENVKEILIRITALDGLNSSSEIKTVKVR